MSNPPRRSRPKKPATTIDLEATTAPAVGYPGPTSAPSQASAASSSASASTWDAETRVADAASTSDTSGAASASEAFAEEEGLRGASPEAGEPSAGTGRTSDFDETILAAAVPDFVTEGEDADRPSGPPAPTYDYNQTSSQPPHDARGGFGSVLGGAILGAALALAGAGALQYAGYIPAVGVEEASDAAPQFARIGDVQQVTTDLSVLRDEVEQLRSAQAAGGTGTGATSADLTAVADRVAAIEQRGEARAASSSENQAAAGAAQETAERAATAADGAKQAADGAKQAADGARQAADAAQKAAEQASQTAGQSQTTAAQAQQTAETASQAAATASQAATTAQQAATGAQTSATAANEAIAAFGTRLDAIENANKQAGVAISAAALKAAIDRGGPFMDELEFFAAASGPTPAVETLRGFAADGVPSTESLAAEWRGVEAQISAVLNPPDPNASVGDQILSGLGGLVQTRAVGAPPAAGAEGPDAALARLDAAIAGKDFAGWLTQWQALPQPAKDASQAFQAKVDARVKTEQIVGETLTDAVKAVGQPSGTAG